MARSTAPAAKAAFLALLGSRPALADVQRIWGPVSEEHLGYDELISVGGVRGRQAAAVLRAAKRDESYSFETGISVSREGDEPQATEERWWALVGEIEDALRTDIELGGTVRSAEIGELEQDLEPTDKGWLCIGQVAIACKARI